MKVSYDRQEDLLSISFPEQGGNYVESEEIAPGLILDFDAEGRVIGVEMLGVQQILREAALPETVKAAE